jgi:hypothetical protein
MDNDKYLVRSIGSIDRIFNKIHINPSINLTTKWLNKIASNYKKFNSSQNLELVKDKYLSPYYPSGELLYDIATQLDKEGKSLFNKKPILTSWLEFSKWHLQNGREHKKIKSNKLLNPDISSPYHPLAKLLYDNSFISMDIHKEAESSPLFYQQWENDLLILDLYSISKDIFIIDKINKITEYIKGFSHNHNKKLHLIVFLSEQKKYLSDIGLTPYSINSGMCVPSKYICIWRKEEFFKVLIHELIHYYQYDCDHSSPTYHALNNHISNRFKIHGFDQVNEAYTDTFAILLHTAICNDDIINTLNYELKHCLIQAAKILEFINAPSDINKITKITQTTSALSYYVVKAGLLLNSDKFIPNIPNPKIKQFGKLISSSLNNDYFRLLRLIRPELSKETGYYRKTMRMSIFDF